jgi:hypothetical protein
LAAAFLLGGCHGSKRRGPEPKPAPKLSFRALDAEQQRLVGNYQPVSQALIAYELAFRDWRAGRLTAAALGSRARTFRGVVTRALARVERDPATGDDVRPKEFLVAGLEARRRALGLDPGSEGYRREWNRSVVNARRALTLLQDIRDRARLIPLPEDSVS